MVNGLMADKGQFEDKVKELQINFQRKQQEIGQMQMNFEKAKVELINLEGRLQQQQEMLRMLLNAEKLQDVADKK